MAGDQPAGDRHVTREELRAELERARAKIEDLEADRWQSHERLIESLASHLNEGFSLLSPSGVQLDVNPAFCAMVGFSREELVGHGLPQPYWPAEDAELHERRFRRLLDEDAASIETTFVRKDGERFPVLDHAHGDARRGRRALLRPRDDQGHDRLEAGRGRAAPLGGTQCSDSRIGHIGTWEYDPTTERFWGSPEARRISGLDLDRSTFSREDLASTMRDLGAGARSAPRPPRRGKGLDLEYEIVSEDSSQPRIVWSVAEVQRDERGEPRVVTGVIQDISEDKRAQNALRESETRFRSLFEDSPVAMWEEDDSAVKARLEELAAAGIDDVIAYLLADPQEYARCIALTRNIAVNKAAVRLFEAESRGGADGAQQRPLPARERPRHLPLLGGDARWRAFGDLRGGEPLAARQGDPGPRDLHGRPRARGDLRQGLRRRRRHQRPQAGRRGYARTRGAPAPRARRDRRGPRRHGRDARSLHRQPRAPRGVAGLPHRRATRLER